MPKRKHSDDQGPDDVNKLIKNSLDSDEEDNDSDDGKYRLKDDDIEGQEDGVVGLEEGITITPFNMKEELEEGHFDNDGMYHWKKDKEVKDNWLENIDWVKVKESEPSTAGKATGSDDDDMPDVVDTNKLYSEILTYLEPKESISQALKRLGGGKSLSASERLKRKKAGLPFNTTGDSDKVSALTGLANAILTHNGNMDIYQETYEKISEQVIASSKSSKAAVEPELDMYADDFEDKEKERLAEVPAEAPAPVPPQSTYIDYNGFTATPWNVDFSVNALPVNNFKVTPTTTQIKVSLSEERNKNSSGMGPKKEAEPINTKDRLAKLKGFKRFLSKEIIEGTWTAGDQAYLDFWTAEKISQIRKLEDMLEMKAQENYELREKLKQTEHDYDQKIVELRSKVNEKCEAIALMTEDNHKSLQGQDTDMNRFDALLRDEEQKFINTREKLSTEIKLLNSKMRNLEEFRAQRDGLIEKYRAQLKHLQALEESATTIVTDYQRLDMINKDRMGQELKERLLKLSIEFQEASQTETTRSLIRENIAINNELGGHIGSWQGLHDQNLALKKQRRLMQLDLRNEEILKEKCLALNVLQTQVLERLAFEHEKLEGFHEEVESLRQVEQNLQRKFDAISKEAREREHEVKLLAQSRHDLETQVNTNDHDYRVLLKITQEDETTLQKALLHVAEGQQLRIKLARNRLPAEEVQSKLEDILKEIKYLVKAYCRKVSTTSSAYLLSTGSGATLYDPDYAIKYWKGHGLSIEVHKDSKKEDRAASPSRKSSSGSSSSS